MAAKQINIQHPLFPTSIFKPKQSCVDIAALCVFWNDPRIYSVQPSQSEPDKNPSIPKPSKT